MRNDKLKQLPKAYIQCDKPILPMLYNIYFSMLYAKLEVISYYTFVSNLQYDNYIPKYMLYNEYWHIFFFSLMTSSIFSFEKNPRHLILLFLSLVLLNDINCLL